ncbi:MAG: 16S rRNA processing protein RimM [Alphaproteobacteria bacterium]|nr:16S rRNA processing protein RimM [Alphaproteobacteria bacterium]MCB9697760.1 16S rRNA processing protein RimM [Alphaproteobacteria bacterium]
MADPHALIELGSIVGVFGVAGEVRVHLHNPSSHLLREPTLVTLIAPDGSSRSVRLSVRSGAGKRILGRLDGVTDRDGAAALMGYRFGVSADALPPEGDGEIYVHRLLGADVVLDGQVIGTLREIHDDGPTPILEVTIGSQVAFVPLLDEFVDELLPDERRITLRPGALVEG